MECIVCGREVEAKAKAKANVKPEAKAKAPENAHLVIGVSCEKCVPRGKKVPFTIRLAQNPEDRQFVFHLLHELFGETEFMEFGQWYTVEEMVQLVAVTEDSHIGLAIYSIEENDPAVMTLLTINVDEPFLRQGVASALLHQVKKEAFQSGVSTIRVPFSNDDLVSYVFYHKHGFRLSGIDIGLCARIHGGEVEGLWNLPIRDELYLSYELKDGK